jgi:hypothetical protein
MRRILLIACIVASSLALSEAVAIEMQPGLWVLTSKSERGGVGQTNPTKVRCISAEESKSAASRTSVALTVRATALLNDRFGKDACKIIESKKTDDGASWLMRCNGITTAEQEGGLKFDSPRHYTSSIRTTVSFQGKTATSTLTSEGRRTGECPK